MGLLDDVLREVRGSGGASDAANESLATELLGLVSGGAGNGGLAGLANMFRQKGLGDVVGSWISTGKNLPVSAEQIEAVLGSSQVQALAAKAGIDPARASQVIAQILPQVVDRCTPNGQLPAGGIMDTLSRLLKPT